MKEGIKPAVSPVISAQCYRVCVENGHTAAVSVSFEKKPSMSDILNAWENFKPATVNLELPLAPSPFIKYMTEENRPQPMLDVDFQRGMGVSIGRLREDNIFDYKFTCLSHNGVRGAAGGGVLTAELLVKQEFI
jgi:aspartate-semialdehyde dehydrogenase